jgi:hypothetical protein
LCRRADILIFTNTVIEILKEQSQVGNEYGNGNFGGADRE